ncbi:MAG TPA: glycosyltransferase [Gemmatimonadales bacterium]
MKLLDVTEFYSPQGGGVRTYLAEKARWLAPRHDVQHVIVVPSNRTAVDQWERSRAYLVRGPAVPASPGYHFLVAARSVADIVRREQPDVIEVGSPYFAPWLARRAARGTRARLVAFVHENPRLYAGRAAGLVARYLRAAHSGFDLAVAAGADNLVGLGVPRTAVVPLGVDTALFHPARRDPGWKPEIGAAAEQSVALYVGRLSAEKGLNLVLDALPALHAVTRVRLVLIGEGHLRRRLERAARRRPAMLTVLPFEPDRARLARAYASADLFVAPCPYETFGLAALEAMASGLPVVGVGAAGIGRLLERADWGRTYRVGDAGDCARALRELLALDLRAAGRRARAVAVERYGWDRTFSDLLALYEELVSGGRVVVGAAQAAARPGR